MIPEGGRKGVKWYVQRLIDCTHNSLRATSELWSGNNIQSKLCSRASHLSGEQNDCRFSTRVTLSRERAGAVRSSIKVTRL